MRIRNRRVNKIRPPITEQPSTGLSAGVDRLPGKWGDIQDAFNASAEMTMAVPAGLPHSFQRSSRIRMWKDARGRFRSREVGKPLTVEDME